MTQKPILPGDIVDTAADAVALARPPLIIRDRLTAFLDERGLGRGPIDISRLGDGHSCETFLLRRAGLEAVLRRAPRPPLTKGQHNIEREARILTALNGAARAPRALATCISSEVLGGPFVILERVPGIVLADGLPAALDVPAERERVGAELVDALVELHACDVRALGLADISRPTIDHVRHLQSMRKLWDANAVRDVPDMKALFTWLEEHAPQVQAMQPTLVHSDYRLGNVLFSTSSPTRLTAILDWETTILGDPLVDLGLVIGVYRPAGDDSPFLAQLTPGRLGPGEMTRAQMAQRYAQRSGRSVERLNWYVAFAMCRTAVTGETLYRRFVDGLSKDRFHEQYGENVLELAALGLAWASSAIH